MAQDPSHPPHQEKQDKEQQKREENTSSSSSNNNHEAKSWLQLGVGSSSISAQDQSEREKITQLQLFSDPVSVAGQGTPGTATHIATTALQVPALEHPIRPFPFLSSGSIRPSAEAGPSASEAGPSTGSASTRVIILPPRPQTGLWFVLRASQNQ